MNAYDACDMKAPAHGIIIATVFRTMPHFEAGSSFASGSETTEFCIRHRKFSAHAYPRCDGKGQRTLIECGRALAASIVAVPSNARQACCSVHR